MTHDQTSSNQPKVSLLTTTSGGGGGVTQASNTPPVPGGDPVLNNLWSQLDRAQPTFPDRLSTAILEGVGIDFSNGDPRLARLVSVAGQKFITDILTDAMGHWRISNGLSTGLLMTQATTPQANTTPSTAPTTPGQMHSPTAGPKPPRATLTLNDLISALNDRGIHVARPQYYK